jgi:hypothetical protein
MPNGVTDRHAYVANGAARGRAGSAEILPDLTELNPTIWLDYVETRLQAGIRSGTLNRELYDLQDFLRFQSELDRPICERMLEVEPLDTGEPLPRDVPLDQLRQLLHQIQ